MKQYTEQEFVGKMDDALKDVAYFYKKGFINFIGITKDTKVLYTEIVAKFVCCNMKSFESIETVTRKNSYKIETHLGKTPISNSNRTEERLAIQLFNEIDEIIDYQIPLKCTNEDKGLGKVDLLYSQDGELYLLELKKEDSHETLIRCIMEGFTYWKMINHEKLIKDFKLDINTMVKQAPLIFKRSKQYIELQQNEKWLSCLIERLGQDIFIISNNDGSYQIEKYINTKEKNKGGL